MGVLSFLLFYSYILLVLFSQEITPASYTLTSSQSITDGQTLVSQGATFELGFFSPSGSEKRYLGIWYKNISVQTVVWVANRDSPLNDKLSSLKIGPRGNLIIVNSAESVIWSSNETNTVVNPVIELLDTGNLVLRDVSNEDPERYAWQSFDYPGDTLLPGMKVGLNSKRGINSHLSSWKKSDDPSNGDYTFGIDLTRYPEAVVRNRGNKYFRSGPWNGLQFSGGPEMSSNGVFRYKLVNNPEEVYYIYEVIDPSVTLRVLLTQIGTESRLQRQMWMNATQSWLGLISIPRDRCDDYGLCGAYSTCQKSTEPVCHCLKGFKPKSPQDWNRTDWSKGCERETLVNCSQGEGFNKFTAMKLPDTTGTWVNMSMDLDECMAKCLKNCSCMAYSTTDISKGGSGTGCVMWFADLIDIRQMDENNAGQDLFIRMAASALDSGSISTGKGKWRIVMIISIALVVGIVVVGLGSWFIFRKKRSPKGNQEKDELELPVIDFVTIRNATNYFAEQNKLGEGGFGPVYKGKLGGEQEIAVKRLSNTSIQGSDEFTNEVRLISKLQHNNLVKLLGCCVQGEEKMLVYEYMPNKSLDYFIFDDTRSALLDWQKRLQIILGIARGLLYLHHDSRLRIIHRDLKASNILLDTELLPKISDFGLARLFKGDQNEGRTKRVMGTYGYMSPEYAVDGKFSVKSDVFSFGVLVLEIISGKKNRGFSHPDHELNLLGHAWKLWSEDRSMELVESMNNSYIVEEVLRCIHIGLLCVQKDVDHRPTMSSVVLMLSSETIVLPKPQQPGFYVERSNPLNENSTFSDNVNNISCDATMSLLMGR